MSAGATEYERHLIVKAARVAWEKHRMLDALEIMRALGFTEAEVQRIFLLRYVFDQRGRLTKSGGLP